MIITIIDRHSKTIFQSNAFKSIELLFFSHCILFLSIIFPIPFRHPLLLMPLMTLVEPPPLLRTLIHFVFLNLETMRLLHGFVLQNLSTPVLLCLLLLDTLSMELEFTSLVCSVMIFPLNLSPQ